MRHIKTFEQYSLPMNEEEGLFKNLMRGSKSFKIEGKDTKKLLDKHKADFSMDGETVKGTKRAMQLFSSLKSGLQMNDQEALEAALKIVDDNGFYPWDPKESKWNKEKKEVTIVPAESKRGTGFNIN